VRVSEAFECKNAKVHDMQPIKSGLAGESTKIVTEQMTAASFGSGLVSAFATPAMIALTENASINAIQQYLESGETSVGVEVSVKHLAATPVRIRVRARAEVVKVDRRRVTFRVEAWDERERIGKGTHVRAIIDEAEFKARISERTSQGQGS